MQALEMNGCEKAQTDGARTRATLRQGMLAHGDRTTSYLDKFGETKRDGGLIPEGLFDEVVGLAGGVVTIT